MACIVVGVSAIPGIGFSAAKTFLGKGLKVGLIGRRKERLEAAKSALKDAFPSGVVDFEVADATEKDSIERAVKNLEGKHGPACSLIYNAASKPFPQVEIADLTAERLQNDIDICVKGALFSSQAVLPAMLTNFPGKSSIIFTGATASLRGAAKFGPFCLSKAALRSMAQSLAKEMNPKGVHVCHAIVDGMVETADSKSYTEGMPEGRLLEADSIAESFWHLHTQNPRCYTFELDVRPQLSQW